MCTLLHKRTYLPACHRQRYQQYQSTMCVSFKISFRRLLRQRNGFLASSDVAENGFCANKIFSVIPIVDDVHATGVGFFVKPLEIRVRKVSVSAGKHSTDNSITFIDVLLHTSNNIICHWLNHSRLPYTQAVDFSTL